MADALTLAKAARKTLSQALTALQHPGLPEELLDIAEPIALSMGVLHRIERSGGEDLRGRKDALANVRKALDQLQECDCDDSAVEAVEQAMEAVAGSLSKLFALSRAKAPSELAAREARRSRPSQKRVDAANEKPVPLSRRSDRGLERPAAPEWPAPKPRKSRPREEAPARKSRPREEPKTRESRPRREAKLQQSPTARAEPATQPRPAPQPAPQPKPQPKPEPQPKAEPAPTGPLPRQGVHRLDVHLGAHSESNFYRGLSGNDVIEHGGLFVATYKLPKIGAQVMLRVLLPGDLEFEADAVVQWTREVQGHDSEPGFGAKIERIAPKGRQLIYRYARNREPMFYDDL